MYIWVTERVYGPALRALADSGKTFPPTLLQYDQWGRRIDKLQTSEGWRELKAIAQREGLPGIFYERKYNEHSRIYGFAKVTVMVGDSNEVKYIHPISRRFAE